MSDTNQKNNSQGKKLKDDKLVQVLLLSSSFAPIDLVSDILRKYFQMDEQIIEISMITLYERGKIVCGVYPKVIASDTMKEIGKRISKENYPLSCRMEDV